MYISYDEYIKQRISQLLPRRNIMNSIFKIMILVIVLTLIGDSFGHGYGGMVLFGSIATGIAYILSLALTKLLRFLRA